MAVNDVMELKVKGFCQDVPTLNVFHYKVITAAATPQLDLQRACSWLTQGVLEGVISFAGVDTRLTEIEATYAIGPTNLEVVPLTLAGAALISCVAPWVTFGFRYNRATSDARNGYKRFSGIIETLVEGKNISASQMTFVVVLAQQMFVDLIDPGEELVGVYRPVILSKQINGQPRPSPIAQSVSSVTGLRRLGSQNTRKG